ncbi:MAG: hypothetical protein IMZ61_14425 [Planctomycetes bacterium]|nr:hypothetical protein [Planctomycetota bacterium]
MSNPSEAGHWYKKDGSPCYTIEAKSGQIRPTTLRDARKLGLVPSVTTVIRCAAAPGLTNWMIDQAILAALTCPRIDGEDETAYLSRIKADSKEQARKASERGILIHAVVQHGFEDHLPLARWDGYEYYASARKTLVSWCGLREWISEKSFATTRYGGKVDLHNDDYLIDVKSTDKDITTLETWDEHKIQLAGYNGGLGGNARKCGILYINVNTAESRLVWIDEKELDKGWKMFSALLDFWYAKTGLEA